MTLTVRGDTVDGGADVVGLGPGRHLGDAQANHPVIVDVLALGGGGECFEQFLGKANR